MIDAPEINRILEEQKEQILCSTTNRKFLKTLKESFNEFACEFKLIRKNQLLDDEYAVSGLYRPETDKVIIIFHINKTRRFMDIKEEEWVDFKFLLSQTLQHEFIHRFQYSKRDDVYGDPEEIDYRYFDELLEEDEIAYLRDSDEIDAYSHDIAMEILFHYKKHNPLDVLKRIEKTRKVWSYRYYKSVFKKHNAKEWLVIKKKLLKKAYTWLPHTTIYR
jgi:hypothetical protein